MLYDDESSKALDGKMEEMVQQVRSFMDNDMHRVSELLKEIVPVVEDLARKPNRTPEEEDTLQELTKGLQLQLQTISDMKAILQASITTRSIALYEHYKKLAGEGNEKAKEIYEELRPYYLAMLQEGMDNKLQ
jgi:hypothetical protein